MNSIDSDNKTKKDIVDNFLAEVKKKLPFWLKDQKKDIEDILQELEIHIMDRATELADGNEPSIEQINEAIGHMGSPTEIANEYKHRGKPKFYITEELFPMYIRDLIIACSVLVCLNFIGMLFSIGDKLPRLLFADFFQGVFVSLAIALIIVTVFFVFLSREGYLPEDFKRITSRLPESLRRLTEVKKEEAAQQKRIETIKTDAASQTQVEYEKPIATPHVIISKPAKPQVIKETIIIKEPQKVEPRVYPREHRTIKYYTERNYLSEGITGMVFGAALIILPFLPVLDFIGKNFRIWIVILGGLTAALGVIRFVQALVGRIQRLQQGLLFLGLIPQAGTIPLFLALIRNHQPLTDDIINLLNLIVTKMGFGFDQNTALFGLTITVYIIIGIISLILLSELVKIIKLETQGIPVREVEEYRRD